MSEKRFRVSFEIAIDSKDYSKEVFGFIANEERVKFDIEGFLESEFTFSVDNLKVEEIGD